MNLDTKTVLDSLSDEEIGRVVRACEELGAAVVQALVRIGTESLHGASDIEPRPLAKTAPSEPRAATPRRAPTASSAPTSKKPRGAKRTEQELAKTADRIASYVAKHPGMRTEEISAALGMTPKEMAFPMGKLREANRVKSTGSARGMKYFPIGEVTEASEEEERDGGDGDEGSQDTSESDGASNEESEEGAAE